MPKGKWRISRQSYKKGEFTIGTVNTVERIGIIFDRGNAKRNCLTHNSHNGLLEAAKAVREYFKSVEPDKLTCSEHAIHWVGIDDKLKSAIAEAEKEL